MSRPARTIIESGVYHILFRGVNQQNIFEKAPDFEKLKETISTVKKEFSVRHLQRITGISRGVITNA